MQPGRVFGRCSAALVPALLAFAPLAAQQRLYVLEADGDYHAVVRMDKDRACYFGEGGLTVAHGTRYALRKVEEFAPAFVEVTERDAGYTSLVPLTGTPTEPLRLNNQFNFGARFESHSQLENVFFVLEIEAADGEHSVFAYEIGRLEASVARQVSVAVPLEREPGSGRCRLMVFVGGSEVFTSEQPEAFREAMLDRMVGQRTLGVSRRGPQPLFLPAPHYPEALRRDRIKGDVRISLRVSPGGKVLEPVVEHASDPAFAAAVLEVLPQWRLVPRIEDGRAVETTVKLPISFALPDAPTGP